MAASAVVFDDDDFLDSRDLILPLDPALIFEAPPHHFQTIVYVKRQHELLDAAIEQWVQLANDCVEHRYSADPRQLKQKIVGLATSHDPRGRQQQQQQQAPNHAFSSPTRWTHQQRLMQALYSVGVELQECPDESLPDILAFLVTMITEPVHDFCDTISRIVKSAKLYCRQTVSLHENALQKYYSAPGKRQDPARDNQLGTSAFETKKEMCKAIYALSATLNNAIIIKEFFIIEKTEKFLQAFRNWRTSCNAQKKSVSSTFDGPAKEVRKYAALTFPLVNFPHDDFKPHFARFCLSFRLPMSIPDLESAADAASTGSAAMESMGRKEGYLFHRNRAGEWSRQYFYILHPQGWLMMFAKGGRDIQVANLRQTLLRPVNVDSRDYVFELCSIDIYLMYDTSHVVESVLQAATEFDFEGWKAALSAWIPPDEEIPAIETLRISTPPPVAGATKPSSIIPPSRPRHISASRVSDAAPTSPRQRRISSESPIVKSGILYVLDYRAKPMKSQTVVGMWKKMVCHIRSNGFFLQYNSGDSDIPFETIPLFTIPRTHISNIDNSLFFKKHCFSIRTAHHVNYYTVSITRSQNDQNVLSGWLYALKAFARPEVFGVDVCSEYRIYRTFSIKVNDGKLNKDVEAYCEIKLDDERRARTGARSRHTKGIEPGTPFWMDSFIFSDLPSFRKGITINVIQVKGSKQLPIGQVDIPVHHRKEWDEGWYPINAHAHRTRSNQHEGDLRLKLRYEEQIVLPMETYGPLLDIVLNFQENNVISKLAELVTDLEGFAKNVLHILEANGLATIWLHSLIDEEIAQASPRSVNTLFRANTLLTKALDAYMRLIGSEYLDDTLGDIVRGICANRTSCEVDPTRLERNNESDLKANWRILHQHTRACWKAVADSVAIFPQELQVVFSHLQMRLTEKFKEPIPSDDADKEDLAAPARYTGVSCFVFLRLICPAILGPKLFCITREHPEAKALRTLTLIAKSLQGLANLMMFGSKESFMIPMNEFITENIQSLKDFIDSICMPEPKSPARVDSSAGSIRSVQIYPPQSPASTNSAIFRTNMTNSGSNHNNRTPNVSNCSTGSASAGSVSSSSFTNPQPYVHNNYSNSSGIHLHHHTQNHHHPQHASPLPPPAMVLSATTTAAGYSPRGSPHPYSNMSPHFANFIPERADELPILPHLIDLGKEMATFATTVANLPSLTPTSSSGEDGETSASNSSGCTRPNWNRKIPRSVGYGGSEEDGEDDHDARDEEDDVENSIVRRVHRVCWHLMAEVEDRVERTAGVEEERRSLSGASSLHQGYAPAGRGGGGSMISREGSRNGDDGGGSNLAGLTAGTGYIGGPPAGVILYHHSPYQQQQQPQGQQQLNAPYLGQHPSPYQQQQQQQFLHHSQQYLMYEHYGGEGDAAAHLGEYYYYYGIDEYDSDEELGENY